MLRVPNGKMKRRAFDARFIERTLSICEEPVANFYCYFAEVCLI